MKELRRLLEAVERANRRWRLFRSGDSLLVALSGGPDSAALLFLLSKLKHKYRFKIFAAHLDHGLHPKHAKKYLKACQNLSRRLQAPLEVKRVRLRSAARRSGRGIEEAGRIARYAFFEEAAEKVRAKTIVTAHTLDDQAETLLMRIFRGSGVRGLCGIPFKRKLGKYELVRPLLLSRKRDLLELLREEKIPFCDDPMNKDMDFTRSRIRHRLLPWIAREFNAQIEAALAGLQSVASQTVDYMDRQTERAFRACRGTASSKGRKVLIRLDKLTRLHPALQGEVLLRAVSHLKGDTKRVGQIHVREALDLLSSKKGGSRFLLPGGIFVRKHPKFLQISLKKDMIRKTVSG